MTNKTMETKLATNGQELKTHLRMRTGIAVCGRIPKCSTIIFDQVDCKSCMRSLAMRGYWKRLRAERYLGI